jgi:hypothetical protein
MVAWPALSSEVELPCFARLYMGNNDHLVAFLESLGRARKSGCHGTVIQLSFFCKISPHHHRHSIPGSDGA